MAFRGLFIGIDRYASSGIDELTCARQDAVALEALFADTLGGTTRVLADTDATRNGIEAAFAELASCDADDTVVIAFSGHGSENWSRMTRTWPICRIPQSRSIFCRNGSRRFPRSGSF
jgi:helicase